MDHHLRQLPLVVRREHPAHKALIDYLLRKGELVPVLPGVHRWADHEETFELRARAALTWQVNGVLLGSSAARLTWWPDMKDETVRIVSATHRTDVPWLVTSRPTIDHDLIVSDKDMRVVTPALSILQMCSEGDGAAISEGLRRRAVTLAELWEVFSGRSRRSQYNGVLRKLLEEARDEPWSPLELRAHRVLREAGITGWKTNVELFIEGRRYFADILFHRERLIVELDGRTHHTHSELDDDNERRNALVRAGWRPLHFSSATLGGMVETVRAILKEARSAWKRDRLPLLPLPATGPNPDGWSIA